MKLEFISNTKNVAKEVTAAFISYMRGSLPTQAFIDTLTQLQVLRKERSHSLRITEENRAYDGSKTSTLWDGDKVLAQVKRDGSGNWSER